MPTDEEKFLAAVNPNLKSNDDGLAFQNGVLAAYQEAVTQLGQLPDVMRQAGCTDTAITSVTYWINSTALPMILGGGNDGNQNVAAAKASIAMQYEIPQYEAKYGPNWRENPEAAAAFQRQYEDVVHGLEHPEEGSFM